jgi:Oxidoreductase family, NAD-binding Rossmann fold
VAALPSGALRQSPRLEERLRSPERPVIDDPDVGIVVVATRHNSYAELTALALKDGSHVWFEKPVAPSTDELAEVQTTWEASDLTRATSWAGSDFDSLTCVHASRSGVMSSLRTSSWKPLGGGFAFRAQGPHCLSSGRGSGRHASGPTG